MSGRIVGEILDNAPEDLTQLELLVLVSIGEEAREKDRTALYNTSAEAIAHRVRSTPSTVRNVLGRLRSRALIIPVHDKVYRGLAQQYVIPKLGEHHRNATINGTGERHLRVARSTDESATAR